MSFVVTKPCLMHCSGCQFFRKSCSNVNWASRDLLYSVSFCCPLSYCMCASLLKLILKLSCFTIDCQFGRGEQKPTGKTYAAFSQTTTNVNSPLGLFPADIWTNDLKLGKILKSVGGKCNCQGRHEDYVVGSSNTNFAALPMKLSQLISSYVQSKHTQMKFDAIASKDAAGLGNNE